MQARQASAVEVEMAASELERYWLAGLLEGEGSFVKGPPSDPRSPIVRLSMTDEDVVCRVGRIFDRAVVGWDRKSERPRKRVFITTLKGAAAVSLMKMLRPAMGTRRQKQIDRALAAPHAARIRARVRGGACTVPSCERELLGRGLCVEHYRSWLKSGQYEPTPTYRPVDLDPFAGEPLGVEPPNDHRSIAWLAGLLEGEGTFSENTGCPRVSVQMTDRDVVERARAVMRAPNVWPKKHSEYARRRGWSRMYATAATGLRGAELMVKLRPFMGERRTRETDRALAAYEPIRLMDPPEVCTVQDCSAPHRGRGLCHKHYMTWSRDRARGREPRVKPLR